MARVRNDVSVVESDVKLRTWATPTPTGPFSLLARDDVVVSAGFTDDVGALLERVPDAAGAESVSEIGNVTERIAAYFDGDLRAVDEIAIEPAGSPRKKAAWEAMRRVPPGPISYRELAERIEQPASARSAARACATNPIALIVPCHRFIGSDGKLHGFYWGLDVKEWLLEHEQKFTR